MRRYSLRLARLRRARRGSRHRSEVCQLRLELLQRLHLQLAHALVGEAAKLAPDRLKRLRLALKAEATLEDESLPFPQPFEPALHGLPKKRPLCLLDGVSGSRIDKKVGELAIAVRADRLIERDRSLSAAKRLGGRFRAAGRSPVRDPPGSARGRARARGPPGDGCREADRFRGRRSTS